LIRTWQDPTPNELGGSVEEFLAALGGPACIRITGLDRKRTRAITTLLHGNEPSGVRALHQFVTERRPPATNVLAFVAAVDAALAAPGFSHRMLPGKRDLNRCFASPATDFEGRVAIEMLARLRDARPEACVDLHNTSGAGPAYAVGTRVDTARLAIASLFATQYILSDIRLGSLMEATADDFPVVTIECGGRASQEADRVAFDGLTRFLCDDSVLNAADGRSVAVLEHPIRVRLAAGADVAYAAAPVVGRALTLRADLDRFNSDLLPPSETIGWADRLEVLTALDGPGRERRHELFEIRDGLLRAMSPLRLFMATTNERIAVEDCMFYAMPC
jgi:hypothetical protein